MMPDPVAAGELQEQIAVEAAGGAEVDVLDLGVMAEPGGTGSRLEALLAARCVSACNFDPLGGVIGVQFCPP